MHSIPFVIARYCLFLNNFELFIYWLPSDQSNVFPVLVLACSRTFLVSLVALSEEGHSKMKLLLLLVFICLKIVSCLTVCSLPCLFFKVKKILKLVELNPYLFFLSKNQ